MPVLQAALVEDDYLGGSPHSSWSDREIEDLSEWVLTKDGNDRSFGGLKPSHE